MNILEQAKNEEFVKEQFIKGRILDDTKDYGRTQFVDEIYELQRKNQQLKASLEMYENGVYFSSENDKLKEENEQLKDKLSKIETLIINHNCDTGDIYYKYNSKFLKSELKQRILEIVYEQGSDSNE